MITQAQLHQLLDYDPTTGVFTWRVNRNNRRLAGVRAGSAQAFGYRRIKIQQKEYFEHRLAWLYVYGVWPDETDHIDGVRNNNAIHNLRIATHTANLQNSKRHVDSRSGFKGVAWAEDHKMWSARIHVQGTSIFLGYFKTPQAAHVAYTTAAAQHFGTFARYA